MNTRQLKQSAMADFMQSLDQLNDLWGGDSDMEGVDDSLNNQQPEKTQPSENGQKPLPAETETSSQVTSRSQSELP